VEYGTPNNLYDESNEEFHFVLDPCTTPDNPLKTRYFFTKEDDGLDLSWNYSGGSIFVNPPYGRNVIEWMRKAYDESRLHNITVVMLLPARTDTKWFHDYTYGKPDAEVRLVKGRLKFSCNDQYRPNNAPFPSCVVVFNPPDHNHDENNSKSMKGI
jgi:phage N-6-adenine-methyltransferase